MRQNRTTIALATLALALGGAVRATAGESEDAEGRGIEIHRLHGAPAGGFLGVQLTELTPELRAHFGVPEDAGVMVGKIVEDSAAQRAGIEVGDVITLVDGESVGSARALAAAIGVHEEGDSVALEIWRDGRMRRLSATLDEREGAGPLPHLWRMHGGHEGMRHGGPHAVEKRIEIRCDDGNDDCGMDVSGLDLDVDCEAGDCEVRVLCEEDGCDCTVNGEVVDCEEIGVSGE